MGQAAGLERTQDGSEKELLVGERRYQEPFHTQPNSHPPQELITNTPRAQSLYSEEETYARYIHIRHHHLKMKIKKSGGTDGHQPPVWPSPSHGATGALPGPFLPSPLPAQVEAELRSAGNLVMVTSTQHPAPEHMRWFHSILRHQVVGC